MEIQEKITFRFEEYNPRRAMRGAPAARVWVDYHDGEGESWLWMDKSDIKANIKEFGECEALTQALKAYGG
jgi:hypothetical protein